jgi:glutathione S-transferase
VRHNTTFTPSGIKDVEDKARSFVQELDKTLSEENQGQRWIFGKRPTIADAHATAMIARLMEVKRQDLLTERVQEYTRGVLASEEWNEVTHGRATRWNASMGDVTLINPL